MRGASCCLSDYIESIFKPQHGVITQRFAKYFWVLMPFLFYSESLLCKCSVVLLYCVLYVSACHLYNRISYIFCIRRILAVLLLSVSQIRVKLFLMLVFPFVRTSVCINNRSFPHINCMTIIYPVKKVTIPTIGHIFKESSAYWS